MKNFLARLLLVLGLAVSGFAAAGGPSAPFTKIVVFGDSQADNGNVFAASGGTRPEPAFYFDSAFMPTGTFSNGKVFNELMAETWGIPLVNVAFGGALTGITNSENDTDPVWAASGFTAFGDTGSVYGASPLPGVLAQIAGYAQQVQMGLIAPDPSALYVVMGMPNDLLALNPTNSAQFQQTLGAWAISRGVTPPIPNDPADGARFQQDLALHIINTGITNLTSALPLTFLDAPPFSQPLTIPAGAIPLLYGIGARNIVVFNVVEARLIPLVTALGPTAIDVFGQLGDNYNSFLAAALGSLQSSSSLPGINIIQVDLQGLDNEINADPAAFGITNNTDACLLVQCFLDPNNGPDGFRYWDTIHPTAKTHEIYAERTMMAAEASLEPPPPPPSVPVTIAAADGGSGATGPYTLLLGLLLLALARRRPTIH